MEIPRLSKKEELILRHLIANGQMYGLQLVKASDGQLKRGTVYVTLMRMDDKGYVTSKQVKDERTAGLPRRLFAPTGHGRRVLHAWEAAGAAFAGAIP